jgi:hypothetical protein
MSFPPQPRAGASRARALAVAVLQAALVASIFGAGWAVHRRLPEGAGGGTAGARGERAQGSTVLRIVLRHGEGDARGETASHARGDEASVQLYPIDVAAARREFEDERRYGQRFEDFVLRRMGARQPVTARFDSEGRALVSVPQGRWWVHATLPGEHEISWRLPVNVSGREQTVELTTDNALTRTKSF